jgi:acyl dehydratase
MLDYRKLKSLDLGILTHTYTQRDTMLYALGIGLGADPLDVAQLPFIYEKNLLAVPSMASVLGAPSTDWRDDGTGVDWLKVVHGEQSIRLFKPLPVAATLNATSRIVSLTDKGTLRGAVMVVERTMCEQGSSEPLASATQVLFLRGNGGFSASSGESDPAPERLPPVPDGRPDVELELTSLPQAALIYRLSGDYNPLHVDPQVARAAGFPRPILHGLCSFGIATHAVLKACCDYDPRRIRSVAMRFSAPVYPGETLRFEIWRVGPATLRLRARASARGIVVLNGGLVELNDPV